MARPEPKVFVSYSQVDDAFAKRFVADLRTAGADVWTYKSDHSAGDFQERIDAALTNCEWFVLVLTKSALTSTWVQQEVHAANRLKHQKRIRDLIFVKAASVDDDELPAMWGVYNIFDATLHYRSAVVNVLRAIGIEEPPTTVVPITTRDTLFGSAQGVVCPFCDTFSPLSDVEIARTRMALWGGSFRTHCIHCKSTFYFTAAVSPDSNS